MSEMVLVPWAALVARGWYATIMKTWAPVLWLCAMGCQPSMAPNDADGDASVVSDGGPGTESCPVATGTGTRHSGRLASSNEVWAAAGNPHIIEFPVTVRMGETLTLEPCVEVRIERNDYLEIGDGARLIAEGTAARPIAIKRQDAEAWRHVLISGYADASLAYVTFEGGGAEVASLRVSIDPNDDVASERTRVDHVTVRGSSTAGVTLEGNAGFTADSRDLTITGSARAPLRTWQRGVGTIPSGTYTGNTTDELVIENGGYGAYSLRGDVTIRERGLPYHVVGGIRVGASSGVTVPATLTIEPGVTLRFDPQTTLSMQGTSSATGNSDLALGSLHAVGTADRPIVFTSAKPAPAAGDWGGLVFVGAATTRTRIEHAVIAYAGGGNGIASASCGNGSGSAGDEAAVTITGWDSQPMSAFIANTRIEHSPRYGIVEGWRGDAVDFVSSNTFVDVASCWVSTPRNRANSCPAMPVCQTSL